MINSILCIKKLKKIKLKISQDSVAKMALIYSKCIVNLSVATKRVFSNEACMSNHLSVKRK